MTIFVILALAVLAAGVLMCYGGLCPVAPMHFGRVIRFGKRGRIVREGLAFLIPFVEKLQLRSIELERIPLEVSVISRDTLEIVIKGSVEFTIDPNLMDQYEETSKERRNALAERIKTELGEVAGVKKAEDFIKRREAIVHLVNCLLRLNKLPHLEVVPITPIAKRLEFYEEHAAEVNAFLESETDKPEERSRLEKDYGVDIKVFNLTDVDFGPETKKALEKKKQDEAKANAAGAKKKLIKDFKDQGATFQEAADEAASSLGQVTERKTHSIHGRLADIKFGG